MRKISRLNALKFFENKNLTKELSTYFEIILNKRHSRTKTASMTNAMVKKDINSLWEEHENIKAEFKDIFNKQTFNDLKTSSFSYLDLKIKIAEKIFENCYFCERRCLVNRNKNIGFCGVKNPRIVSEFLHIGEEAPLVPSHTIFFAGCNFECVYCQNFDISQFPESGIEIHHENIAKIIDARRREDSRNVNFVGGDPTPNLPFILKTMQLCNENIPVVWNSNFYMSKESMNLLDGFVDLYLTDFKYGPGCCAVKLSEVQDYWNIVTRNHKIAKNAGDMIIRHLVLPNHVECCSKPILKWIRNNLGKEVVVNIMGQYRPVYKAHKYKEITGFPSHQEIQETINYAKRLGLLNII